MIVNAYGSPSVPLSSIASVHNGRREKTSLVKLLNGEEVEILGATVDDAFRNYVQASFPADGAQLVHLWPGEAAGELNIELSPILGFFMDGYGELQAVTIDGNVPDPTVLFPNGLVQRFEERWPSIDDYVRAKSTKEAAE